MTSLIYILCGILTSSILIARNYKDNSSDEIGIVSLVSVLLWPMVVVILLVEILSTLIRRLVKKSWRNITKAKTVLTLINNKEKV